MTIKLPIVVSILNVWTFLVLLSVFHNKMAASKDIPHQHQNQFLSDNAAFTSDLFHRITELNYNNNTILSPFSIQTCIAMSLFAADGATASEIIAGLHLSTTNKPEIASNFEKLLKSVHQTSMMKIANKIFTNQGYEIKKEFNELAIQGFQSEVETLDFSQAKKSVDIINDWVERQTNNKIQNLLTDDAVDQDTSMLLVNAIYFKGEWDKPFSDHSTHKSDFWLTQNEKTSVDMMLTEDDFQYGEYDDLDARGIEMTYKNSEFSMMILLPNQRDGLQTLLAKLSNSDLLDISNKMSLHDVNILLPKFKVEFSITLNDVLKSMGMKSMFTENAEFPHLFNNNVKVKVSQVIHKAFIDVNEAGSEAAAATYMKITPMSLNFNQKQFIVDHPFIYLIKDKTSIYFIGHVTKF